MISQVKARLGVKQMKLYRLWKDKKISTEEYAERTLALIQQWAIEHCGVRK